MGKAALSRKETPLASDRSTRRELIEVHSLGDVPDFATDDEAAAFWDTHGMSKHFLDTEPEFEPDWLPPPRPRTTPVAVRFDQDVIARLKTVAEKKHKGYQTLLKEFVTERLYEEEKREGILPARK